VELRGWDHRGSGYFRRRREFFGNRGGRPKKQENFGVMEPLASRWERGRGSLVWRPDKNSKSEFLGPGRERPFSRKSHAKPNLGLGTPRAGFPFRNIKGVHEGNLGGIFVCSRVFRGGGFGGAWGGPWII